MKFALIALALLASSAAIAHGSSHPPQTGSDGGSLINAEAAPRAFIWDNDHLWQRTDGVILVCPHEFRISSRQWEDFECYNDKVKGDGKQSRWMPLQNVSIPGMVLKSYEYRFIGASGSKVLVAYYGPPAKPVDPVAMKDPSITLTGPITIKADKVIVQRKR